MKKSKILCLLFIMFVMCYYTHVYADDWTGYVSMERYLIVGETYQVSCNEDDNVTSLNKTPTVTVSDTTVAEYVVGNTGAYCYDVTTGTSSYCGQTMNGIKTIKEGTTTVTCTWDSTHKATTTIYVYPKSEWKGDVGLSPTIIGPGDVASVYCHQPGRASVYGLPNISVSNPNIAYFQAFSDSNTYGKCTGPSSKNGSNCNLATGTINLYTGNATGDVTVTCSWGDDYTATETLTVTDTDVVTVYVGQTIPPVVEMPSSPEYTTIDGVTAVCNSISAYRSSNPSIAYVGTSMGTEESPIKLTEQDGRVTGVKEGYATISAYNCGNYNYKVVRVLANASNNPKTGSVMFILTLIFVPLSIIFALVAFLRIRKM